MNDRNWFLAQKRKRTIEYFLVLSIYHELKQRHRLTAGFFANDFLLTAIRRVRKPRRYLATRG
jgi:hypothetical protein